MGQERKSRGLIVLALAWFVLCAFEGSTSNPLGPQAYLRKLSLHIRDLDPSRAEYDDLAAALKSGSERGFFEKKISEYLKSTQHVDKMNYRLNELFYLKPSAVPAELRQALDSNSLSA